MKHVLKNQNDIDKGAYEKNYVVELINISKYYGEQEVFKNINLNFEEYKITIILGPSGCGKTTLLNIISGLEKADSGKVVVKTDKISYIFQEDTLIPWFTVYENIAFVLKSRFKKEEMNKIINKYISLVKLEQYKNKLPQTLSGGMKRRVAMARAFAYEGDLLLMDEPFKGLDRELKGEIINDFLEIWRKEKKSVILVTHDIEEAKILGDYIYKWGQFSNI